MAIWNNGSIADKFWGWLRPTDHQAPDRVLAFLERFCHDAEDLSNEAYLDDDVELGNLCWLARDLIDEIVGRYVARNHEGRQYMVHRLLRIHRVKKPFLENQLIELYNDLQSKSTGLVSDYPQASPNALAPTAQKSVGG